MRMIRIALIALAMLFPVASAEPIVCDWHETTQTYVCVDASGTEYADVTVQQAGAAGVSVYRFESTWWGSTFRSTGASVYTFPDTPLGQSYSGAELTCFDFGSDDQCDYQNVYTLFFLGDTGSAGTGTGCADSDGDTICDDLDATAGASTVHTGSAGGFVMVAQHGVFACYWADGLETAECTDLA